MTYNTPITADTIVTGAEFKDFYQNHWPKEWYVEDMHINFEDDRGEFCLDLEAKNALGGFGWAGWQGSGKPVDGETSKPIWELYAKAMSQQPAEILVAFKIDLAKAQDLIKAAEALGARHI